MVERSKIKFEDAQELAKLHPDTFEAPSLEKLNNLKIGDLVKVCTHNERFWNIIESINGETIIARIDNDLLCTEEHGLSDGDIIEFEFKNIYQILKN